MPETLDQEIRTLQSLYWSERDPEGLAFAPLADALLRKGEVREALDLLTDGTSRHPEFATGHVVATRLYFANGLEAEAEIAARRVLRLDPENVVGLSLLGTLLDARGERGEAEEFRQALAEVDPEYEDAARGLGRGQGGPATAVPPELEDDVASALETHGLDDAVDLGNGLISIEGVDFGSMGLISEPEGDLEAADSGALAPDVEPELEIMDLGALAPDVEPELEIMDLSALAPDVEPELEIMDLSALAPDVEPEPEIMDLSALAPDAEPELEIMELGALAPDPEPEWDVWDLGALAPDPEPVPVASLAPDVPSSQAKPMDSSEPVRTRTLAELYVRQGFTEQALGVYRHLLEQEPDAPDLPARIAELETGGAGPTDPPRTSPASESSAATGSVTPPSEDEVETLARDLAESGGAGHDVDTPFAWTQDDGSAKTKKGEPGGIGDYFDNLLSWGSDGG